MLVTSQVNQVLDKCRAVFPEWRPLSVDDFEWDEPKGFSSFTMGIRCLADAEPPAVLYRGLEGKQNAILDRETERDVFLLLGEHRIAARCLYYDNTCRLEEFYEGRSLTPADLTDSVVLKGVAGDLFRLHQLTPDGLPERSFFELLHDKWGILSRTVLDDHRDAFPPNEQAMCHELRDLLSDETAAKVQECLPTSPMTFSHNDTYHGNVMLLNSGDIKLLDFEFSCLPTLHRPARPRRHRSVRFERRLRDNRRPRGAGRRPAADVGGARAGAPLCCPRRDPVHGFTGLRTGPGDDRA